MWPVLCSEKLDSHDHLFLKKKKKKRNGFQIQSINITKEGLQRLK